VQVVQNNNVGGTESNGNSPSTEKPAQANGNTALTAGGEK